LAGKKWLKKALLGGWVQHHLPWRGISPPKKLAGWRVPTGVVSWLLVDPNNKVETISDGNGLKALTWWYNMGSVSV
jgi:hypothetical protein